MNMEHDKMQILILQNDKIRRAKRAEGDFGGFSLYFTKKSRKICARSAPGNFHRILQDLRKFSNPPLICARKHPRRGGGLQRTGVYQHWSTPTLVLVSSGISVGQHRYQPPSVLVNTDISVGQHRHRR